MDYYFWYRQLIVSVLRGNIADSMVGSLFQVSYWKLGRLSTIKSTYSMHMGVLETISQTDRTKMYSGVIQNLKLEGGNLGIT